MRAARLSMALEAGLVLPSEGRLGVFRPRADDDLSLLPRARTHIIQEFRPDFEAFRQAGYSCAHAPEGRFAASIVCVTRSREQTRGLIAQAALVTDGLVIVDGQKNDGIDSVLRECRARVRVGGPVSKGHGKLFWFNAAEVRLDDWAQQSRRLAGGFETVPGVFSADGVDPGSALLAQALPAQMQGRGADLGAGWGYLSAMLLSRPSIAELHLVEAEHDALDCARRNVTDTRARFHWADATSFEPGISFDWIVSNPPFHQSRAAEPGLGVSFIAAAARLLAPNGAFWMVANRHLPYEAALGEYFREFAEYGGDRSFKIIRAAKPNAVARTGDGGVRKVHRSRKPRG